MEQQKEISFMIGLETHIQLKTKSKLFCSCINPVYSNDLPPNAAVCDVCLGFPGTKPTLNKKAVELALKLALALNCKINKEFFFSRKTYFYPDLAKNYQITQYEIPLGERGYVTIKTKEGKEKKIRIRRIHIEEDPARIVHKRNYTLVDYNRSGVPLVEIVTEPDLEGPEEVRDYLTKLMQIAEYIDAFDSTKGSFKSDLNISIKGGERVEVKNITGIKEVEIAAHYEILRQKNAIKRNTPIKRETRRWDEKRKITVGMREKETEEDYGYIFEPDLPSIVLSEEEITETKNSLPELPDEKIKRLMNQYNISYKMAEALASEKEIADLFERFVAEGISIKNASTWVGVVLKKILNYHGITYKSSNIKEAYLYEVIKWYEEGKFNDYNTEMIMRKLFEEDLSPQEIVKKYNFKEKLSDESLQDIVDTVIDKYQNAVNDYLSGKEKALEFLVGMVLKETKGAADPKTAREYLLRKLGKNHEKV